MNNHPKWSVCMQAWWVKTVINGWENKDIKGTWYIQIQEWWDNFNFVICSCSECNLDIIVEVVKVDNLVSTEGERFEGTKKWAKINVLCGYQILLAIEWWMQMVSMGCHENIIFCRLCFYWWWVCIFAVLKHPFYTL